MKRLWFGVALLVILLLLGIGSTLAMEWIHSPIARQLESASEAALAGHWQEARILAAGGIGLRSGKAVEEAVGLVVEAEDAAAPAVVHDLYGLLISGLETDGGAGGDVEVLAPGEIAIEIKGRVGFVEVELRANLYSAVAGVGNFYRSGRISCVAGDLPICEMNFSRNHKSNSLPGY